MSKINFTQSSNNITAGFHFTGQSVVNASPKNSSAPLRNSRGVRAGYDATKTNDYNKRAWSNAGPIGLSADDRNSNSVRQRLKNRSRYEYDNGGFSKRIVNKTANEIVGRKIKVSVTSSNKELNKKFEKDVKAWKKSIQLERKLRVMARAKISEGEGLALPYTNKKVKGKVKLDLAVISCDRLTSFDMTNQPNNIDGVILDELGINVAQYEIAACTPGSYCFSRKTTKYNAEDVYHWYEQEYPEQHRGIPELTVTLELNSSSRRFTMAAVDAAEQAARLSHTLTQSIPFQEDEDSTQDDYKPLDTFDLERGQVTILDEGQEIKTNQAPQPVDTHKDFKESLLQEVSAWSPLTQNMIMGTSKDMNYSSARFDYYVMFGKDRDIMRDDMELVVLDDLIGERYLEEWSLHNTQFIIPEELEITFAYEADKYLNPLQEAKADSTRLSSVGEDGLPMQTRKSYHSSRGEDWQDEFDQMEIEAIEEAESKIRIEVKIKEMREAAGLAPTENTGDENDNTA